MQPFNGRTSVWSLLTDMVDVHLLRHITSFALAKCCVGEVLQAGVLTHQSITWKPREMSWTSWSHKPPPARLSLNKHKHLRKGHGACFAALLVGRTCSPFSKSCGVVQALCSCITFCWPAEVSNVLRRRQTWRQISQKQVSRLTGSPPLTFYILNPQKQS